MGASQDTRMIVFDVGNTLVDLDLARAIRHLGGPEPVPATERELAGTLVGRLNEFYRTQVLTGMSQTVRFPEMIAEVAGLPPLAPARVQAFMEQDRTRCFWDRPRAGATEAIQALRGMGMRIGVLSNANGHVAGLLEQLGLVGFDWVIDSALVGVAKPDPRIFQLALEYSGLPPEAVTYVGDLPWLDGAGALAAGLSALCLDPLDLFQEACAELKLRFGREVPRVRSLLEIAPMVRG